MHLFFYTLFLALYQLGIKVAAIANAKARLWLRGRRQIFEQLEAQMVQDGRQVLWMHASSLGEFEQGRPVFEALRKQYPNHRFLLTFFSPSGYEVRKNYPGADAVFYLPLDSKKNARRFLDLVQPSLVLWIKYDYWYYYLAELRKRNIPALLISGAFRPGQPFFKWYGRLHRYMLESFHHLFVQNQASANLLATIGFSRNVTVVGDTRFDRVAEIAASAEAMEAVSAFCGTHPVLVAGSTWPEDEEELRHYANAHPNIRFIIAPHDIAEARLQQVERLFGGAIRFSALKQGITPSGTTVLLIDNIGLLARLYRYGTLCYIGGGFGKDGVHNVLEAAVYGKPLLFGPEFEKYQEAIGLVEAGAAFSIESTVELEKLANELLADPVWLAEAGTAARRFVQSGTGATAAILHYIQVNRLFTI